MLLQFDDDGTVSSVNEEELIYVNEKELEEFIEKYRELETENEQLRQFKKVVFNCIDEKIIDGNGKYNEKYSEAKIKNEGVELSEEVKFILDTVFYWNGYVKSLEELKKELTE